MPDAGRPSPGRPPPPAPGPQFVFRAVAVITGLTLLLVVQVHGVAFYAAWSLIGLALVTETVATLLYWHRSRRR